MNSKFRCMVTVAGVLSLAGVGVVSPSLTNDDSVLAQQQATVSGSATSTFTVTTIGVGTNSLITSVAGSVTLPLGQSFADGNVIVNPTFDSQSRVTALGLILPPIVTVPPNTTFSRQAAEILQSVSAGNASVINNIEALSALIRAGAGVDGLD